MCWDSHTHSLQDSGGLYHLPAQASGLPGLELPSSDESSQSSSLLCVTQSRGPGNLESRACLVGGSRGGGGLCPPPVQLSTAGSPDTALPGGGSGGVPLARLRSLGLQHGSLTMAVSSFPLATRFPTHTSSQGRLPAPQTAQTTPLSLTSCPGTTPPLLTLGLTSC